MAGKISDENIILQYLDVFRKLGHYCDLVVIVNEERFRCHRFILAATSGYFNSLFNSSFPDSTAAEIEPLKDVEVDAGIFRIILQYMYTGKIDITSQNAYILLKTSDYLDMKDLKSHCMRFIEGNPLVENTLKICHLALTPLSDSKFAEIAVKNAFKNFQKVVQTDEFLTIDFELLEKILKEKPAQITDTKTHCSRQMQKTERDGIKWYCSYCGNYFPCEDVKISFERLADWIMHDVVSRIKYFPKLANHANLNAKYISHWEALISKYVSELGIWITENEAEEKQWLRIYTITENNHLASFEWDRSGNRWSLYEKYESSFDTLKTLVIRNIDQYILTSTSTNDGLIAKFWIDNPGKEWIELESPPLFGKNCTLACIDNSIFLYMCDENRVLNYETLSCVDLKAESGSNNIYVYMPDLQKWLSIPQIPTFLFNSYFVSANNLLFVIGGTTTHSTDCGAEQKLMQVYDPRSKKWSEKSFDVDLTLKGAACGYNEKIYICEQTKTKRTRSLKNRAIYIYDVVSEKWKFEGVKQNAASISLLIPYDNRLWAIPNSMSQKVEVYDLDLKTWSEVPNLPSFVEINEVDCEIVQVLDGAVVR